MRQRSGAVVAVVLIASAIGCEGKRPAPLEKVAPSQIEIQQDELTLRTDTVGSGKFEHHATFVLVDAVNHHDADALVTLGGDLVDPQGHKVGTLRADSLRIPPGVHRTYALIDSDNQARPTAIGATITLVSAVVPRDPEPVVVTDGHVYADGDVMMASGRVVNNAKRDLQIVVIGAFYDAEGHPLTRPFTVMELAGGSSHPVHFRSTPGPRKAKTGYIFTGQVVAPVH